MQQHSENHLLKIYACTIFLNREVCEVHAESVAAFPVVMFIEGGSVAEIDYTTVVGRESGIPGRGVVEENLEGMNLFSREIVGRDGGRMGRISNSSNFVGHDFRGNNFKRVNERLPDIYEYGQN